jgi:hypothetical protein
MGTERSPDSTVGVSLPQRAEEAKGRTAAMNDLGKSDKSIVSKKPANEVLPLRAWPRSRWREGTRPRGTRNRIARPGRSAGTRRVTRLRPGTRERVIGSSPPPKARAVCGSSARTDPCGGGRAQARSPTATS